MNIFASCLKSPHDDPLPRRTRRLHLSLLASCLLLLLGTACGMKNQRSQTPSNFNSTLWSKIQIWQQQQQGLQGLKGFSQVEIQARGKKQFFDAAVLASFPDRLKLVFLDEVGQSQFLWVADGQNVSWLNPQDPESLEQIPQGSNDLQKSLSIPLSVSEFLRLLVPKLPQETQEHPEQIALTQEGIFVQWKRTQAWFAAGSPPQASLQLRRLALYQKDGCRKLRYEVNYGAWTSTPQGALASQLRFSFAKPKMAISVQFRQLQSFAFLPETDFSLETSRRPSTLTAP